MCACVCVCESVFVCVESFASKRRPRPGPVMVYLKLKFLFLNGCATGYVGYISQAGIAPLFCARRCVNISIGPVARNGGLAVSLQSYFEDKAKRRK